MPASVLTACMNGCLSGRQACEAQLKALATHLEQDQMRNPNSYLSLVLVQDAPCQDFRRHLRLFW